MLGCGQGCPRGSRCGCGIIPARPAHQLPEADVPPMSRIRAGLARSAKRSRTGPSAPAHPGPNDSDRASLPVLSTSEPLRLKAPRLPGVATALPAASTGQSASGRAPGAAMRSRPEVPVGGSTSIGSPEVTPYDRERPFTSGAMKCSASCPGPSRPGGSDAGVARVSSRTTRSPGKALCGANVERSLPPRTR